MRITVKASNISLTPELREYALEKIGSLERFFKDTDPDSILVEIEIGRPSQHHRKGEVFRCEVNVSVGKRLLRAEELAETMVGAIDLAYDEIRREVKKMQAKWRDQFLRAARKLARRFKFFR